MHLLVFILKASFWSVIFAIGAGLLSGISTTLLIALINRAVSYTPSFTLAWYFYGLVFFILVTSSLSQFLLINLTQKAIYELRIYLCVSILSAPLRHLENLGSNKLLATLIEDIQTISVTVFLIPFICIDLAIIIGCLTYLSLVSNAISILVLLFIIIGIFSIQKLLAKSRYFLSLSRKEEDNLFKHFHTIVEGIKELKLNLLRREDFLIEELKPSAKLSCQYNVTALTTLAMTSNWGQFLFFTMIGLLLFGLPEFIKSNQTTSITYILTITYLLLPIKNILERLPALFKASVALQKVKHLELTIANQSEQKLITAPIKNNNWKELYLNQIVHSYGTEEDNNGFLVGPLDMSFYPGEIIFIIGGNGSGKSTLAKLITGLYIPESGKIEFDNQIITDNNREWYRQHFAVVFSDFYLFERLLGTNIFDLDTQAQEYLKQFELAHKVKVKDGRLSTTLLSQGQRKRLSLLHSYLEDRPIYLFDEWASDQDPIFRDIFYRQLLPKLKERGKTVFVISHDDRYFNLADRVIKLDYGKVEYDK